jgi:hypothetical protein
MPNWCENTLSANGTAEDISAFVKWLDDKPFSFERIDPTPEELKDNAPFSQSRKDSGAGKELIEKFGSDNWYDWRVQNWGCKWDIDENQGKPVHSSAESIGFEFQTPWGPPEKAIYTLSLKFPTLTFFLGHYEMGCGFAGEMTVKNGESEGTYYDAEENVDSFKQYVSERWGIEFDEEEETVDSN